MPLLTATTLTVSALIASASRGGFFSTSCALVISAALLISTTRGKTDKKWTLVAAGVMLLLLLALFWLSGGTLVERLGDLGDVNGTGSVRTTLWISTWRMIVTAPLTGLGLGSFESAYPMYAAKALPFVMDKAHNDYLEFAAGVGIPAACCWWGGLIWCIIRMLRGIFIRKRDRIYPLIGVGATALVAIHSLVDFSLQIPAVAITYATILSIGVAQSYPTQKSRQIPA
jgi:O-antigen ligase